MASIDCKQTTSRNAQQHQPRQTASSPQDQRLLLIQNVRKCPSLYKNEFLRTPFLHRNEKQQMWDKIAQESGFDKTEDAKCKWRSLINYLRHHLDSVAQKKIRRYIPNTENPEDKYVQLTDWQYYSEMEFIVPYVKYSSKQDPTTGKSAMEMLPSEIDMIIEGIENDVGHKNEHEETQTPNTEELSGEGDPKDKVDKLIQLVSNDDLTEDDEILKEYFENMLKTTLNLPRFHQNRIKQKLLDTVNECE